MSGNGGQVPRMLLLSDPSDGSSSSTPAAGSVLDRIKQFLPQIASANAQLEAMNDGDMPSMDCGITVEKLTAQDSDDSDDDSSSGDEEAASQDESDEERQVHQNDEAESREVCYLHGDTHLLGTRSLFPAETRLSVSSFRSPRHRRSHSTFASSTRTKPPRNPAVMSKKANTTRTQVAFRRRSGKQ